MIESYLPLDLVRKFEQYGYKIYDYPALHKVILHQAREDYQFSVCKNKFIKQSRMNQLLNFYKNYFLKKLYIFEKKIVFLNFSYF